MSEVNDTDIVFQCPNCMKEHAIDYRGAGLRINCSECGEEMLVPIPEGMELKDLDVDRGELLKELFSTRRRAQQAELQLAAMRERFEQLQETVVAMQDVIAEGLAGEDA